MKNHKLLNSLAVIAGLLISGCSVTATNPTVSVDPAETQRRLDANVDGALAKLYEQVPLAHEMISEAKGVLVFPSMFSIGFVVGSSQGQGALRIDDASSSYYEANGLKLGWLAGAKSEAIYVLFMTTEALEEFSESKGWSAGIDASVAFAKAGANTSVSTENAQQAIVSFALTNKGVMANISLEGSKLSKLTF